MEDNMPKKVRTGRLDSQMVAKREKWVLEQFKKHANWTKDDLNTALIAQKDLGSMPMRPVRVYEIKRAAAAGASTVPPVQAGKRPSKRVAAGQATDGHSAAPTSAARAGRPLTQGQEQVAVQAATKLLQQAGLEDIQISYQPPRRTVTVG